MKSAVFLMEHPIVVMADISDEEWQQLLKELSHDHSDLPTDLSLYEFSGLEPDLDQTAMLQSVTTTPDEQISTSTAYNPPLATESEWVQEPGSKPCRMSERPTEDIHLLVEQLQQE